MSKDLLDAFRHNTWATITLINFCRQFSDEELNASISTGTFGSIMDTLRHITAGRGYYEFLVSGEWPGWESSSEGQPGLDELEKLANKRGLWWEEFLAGAFDPEKTVKTQGQEVDYETKLGTILAQALHHPNHHRAETA